MQQHQTTVQVESDDDLWNAFVNRDRTFEGHFVLAVHTTGIFCRPGCPARTPKRENTSFFETAEEAIRAGFRPCKRCRPLERPLSDRHAGIVREACQLMEQSTTRLTLDELASQAGISPYHFQRIFKQHTGVTPAQYQRSHRSGRLRETLRKAVTVTHAMNESGYSSSSQFYETAGQDIGMTPTVYRSGGVGERIRFGVAETWLGFVLVAATDRGICSLQMGDSAEEMKARLFATFPHSEFVEGDPTFVSILQQVATLASQPSTSPADVPLDVTGTVFQHRVWNALRKIPAGTTRTYSEVAVSVGSPKAIRAVAKACADNPVPLLIPCHRVIGKNGKLTGYRYGVKRKQGLLDRESGRA